MKVLLVIVIVLIGLIREGKCQSFDTTIICKTYKHPLGHKIWKGAKMIFVADVATMGLLAVLPPDFSNWNKDFFKNSLKTFGKTFVSLPVWDNDNAFVNYIGHPVGGALYYNTLRSQGAS